VQPGTPEEEEEGTGVNSGDLGQRWRRIDEMERLGLRRSDLKANETGTKKYMRG
jgi:hypothetical protein